MRQAALFADKNFLYSGDNLRVLRHRLPDDFVDLIYLDPPFKSNQDYNVLFKERTGNRAAAQIKAFSDTWRWDKAAMQAFHDVVENGPAQVGQAMQAFRSLLGDSDMLAYLSMMAPRLVEMHRVLRETGSIYLHCDPTASHYLKSLMDAVFGPQHFRNEIIWRRTSAHSSAKKFGPVHDVLLYYSKSSSPKWNEPRTDYSQAYLNKYYKYDDGDGRLYWRADITGAGTRQGESGKPWRGFDPTDIGRHWSATHDELEAWDTEHRIYFPKGGGMPQYKRYRDELKGRAVGDIWDDIDRINPQAAERIGFPTQKPLALLERIIETSSNIGDTVLDPFCGCGTTIEAAESLGRRWIGIDITQLAMDIVLERLGKTYGPQVKTRYELFRDPASADDARRLAKDDPYQFQWWVLDRVGAQKAPHKKGADKGIDGKLFFQDSKRGPAKQILISVKGGRTGPAHVRDLRGVMDREKATIGVLVTTREPTRQMRVEAASLPPYHSKAWGQSYPRLQILTVDEILGGEHIEYPSAAWLFKRRLGEAQSERETVEAAPKKRGLAPTPGR